MQRWRDRAQSYLRELERLRDIAGCSRWQQLGDRISQMRMQLAASAVPEAAKWRLLGEVARQAGWMQDHADPEVAASAKRLLDAMYECQAK